MPVISRKDLVAKNKSGNGLRNNDTGNNRRNNAAVKKIADILIKVSELAIETDEALADSIRYQGDAFNTMATTPINQNTQGKISAAMRALEGFSENMQYVDPVIKLSSYDYIVSQLQAAGSSKQEFDGLLRTANEVLELGLEKTILKPVDPREQERQRQEAERQRQEEERRRREEERQRQEQERLRQEQERQRQEEERQRREQLARESRQRREARQASLRMGEDYVNTNFADPTVDPIKIDPEYQMKNDLGYEADPIERRQQEKYDASQKGEEEPVRQTRTIMISQDIKDSFYRRYPVSEVLTARDIHGNEIVGTDNIVERLCGSDDKLFIYIPTDSDHRCICLQGEEGKLLVSPGPVYHGDPDIELVQADSELSFSDQFERFYQENGIESAVGEDGTVYTDIKDMKNVLEGDSRLMLFGKDKAFAFAVRRQGVDLYTTEKAEQMQVNPDWVSPDRIPEHTKLFGIKDSDILYAVTRDGQRLETPEAIRNEIRAGEGMLRIHTLQNQDAPYVLDYREGTAAITKYPVHVSQVDKLTEEDYRGCLPEEIEEKYILNWKESDLAYAVGADGRRYNTPEEIKTALYGSDKILQIYTKTVTGEGENAKEVVDELPFAVEKKNSRFFIVPERVPKFEDQMQALGEQLSEMDAEDFDLAYKPMTAKDFLAKHWMLAKQSDEAQKASALIGMDFEKQPRIDFALDENGNVYDSVDKIAAELDKPDDRTLFIFEKNGEFPFAIQKKDGLFYKSDDRISTKNIMPSTYSFDAKKSLNVDELGDRPDATDYFGLKDQHDDAGKLVKFYKKEIDRITKIKNGAVPVEPKKPVRPRLGGWNTFVRGLKKVFTFGLGETDAYRAYTGRKHRYEEDLKSYPDRQKEFAAKKKEYDDIQQNGGKMLEEARKSLEKAETKLGNIKTGMNKAASGLDEDSMDRARRDVVKYRDRIEAKVEGVADLRNTGKITPENIFAHTWLKKAQCSGKPASDPEARKALCAYIAADSVQNELLDKRFKGAKKDAQTSDALDQRKVAPLNNGQAVEALMNDKDLSRILDNMGGNAIDPDKVKDRYIKQVAERESEALKDNNVYKQAMADMDRQFGRQKLSEQALDEVIRYKKIKTEIDRGDYVVHYSNAKLGLADIFAVKPTEADKKPYREAFEALKENGPMGLDEMSKALDGKRAELDAQKQAGGPAA